MAGHTTRQHHENNARMRGFVSFIAILMWFLGAILMSRPAAAQDILRASDIIPNIEVALLSEGMPSDAQVSLDNPTQAIAAGATLSNVSYNPLSGRFVIRLSGSGPAITGFAKATQAYPVLKHAIDRGDAIADSDIEWLDAPTARSRNVIENADELIGMSARRPLAANTLLRSSDVEAPTLVKKGAIVTLTYEVAGLRMTHQGVASANGASGEVISVRNLESDRTLKGVVAGKNIVSIIPRRSALEG